MASRAKSVVGKRKTGEKAERKPAFAAPREKRKTLSVDLPEERHRILKAACATEGVNIRNVLLAVIDNIDQSTDVGKALIEQAQTD